MKIVLCISSRFQYTENISDIILFYKTFLNQEYEYVQGVVKLTDRFSNAIF